MGLQQLVQKIFRGFEANIYNATLLREGQGTSEWAVGPNKGGSSGIVVCKSTGTITLVSGKLKLIGGTSRNFMELKDISSDSILAKMDITDKHRAYYRTIKEALAARSTMLAKQEPLERLLKTMRKDGLFIGELLENV